MSLEITPLGGEPVKALVIGSILDTLQGHVAPHLQNRRFQAEDYLCGFEAASPEDLHSIGESLLVNDICYATSTGAEKAGQLIAGDEFVTGGFFLLPKAAKPSHRLTLTTPLALEQLFEAIYSELKRPVVLTGFWESESLYTAAIAKPPIDGLPIFDNPDYYFPVPHRMFHGVNCFVMGVMTSYSDSRWKPLNKQLEAVLYKNPYDGEFALSSHTHGLILKPGVKSLTPEGVEHCVHIFTDKTLIRKADLQLYALDQIDQI